MDTDVEGAVVDRMVDNETTTAVGVVDSVGGALVVVGAGNVEASVVVGVADERA